MHQVRRAILVFLLATSNSARTEVSVHLADSFIWWNPSAEAPALQVQFGRKSVNVFTVPAGQTPQDFFGRFSVGHSGKPLLIDGQQIPANESQIIPLAEPHWSLVGDAGNYYPANPLTQLKKVNDTLQFGWNAQLQAAPSSLIYIGFSKTTPAEMKEFSAQMTVPLLAPVQITQNDDTALIFYDKATSTTAYLVRKPEERMNSVGYLNGCDGRSAILIHREKSTLTVAAGTPNPDTVLRLKLFGDWQLAPGENGSCKLERKAGRTWIEFSTGPETSETTQLLEMPSSSFVRRWLDLIKGK